MKKTLALCCLILLSVAINATENKNLLTGGDFENIKLSNKWLNQWMKSYYVHANQKMCPDLQKIKAQLKPVLTQKIITANDNSYLELSSPVSTMTFRPGGKPMISNRITQFILIHASGKVKNYELKFKFRGHNENVEGLNSFHVFAFYKDNKNKDKGKMLNIKVKKMSPAWVDKSLKIKVPPGTTKLGIAFALYGCGKLNIDDIRLTKQAQ